MSVSALVVNDGGGSGLELAIVADGDEDITVQASQTGQLQVLVGSTERGVPQTLLTNVSAVPASQLTTINIEGGSEANEIDLSRVTVANGFSDSVQILVQGGNGNDVLTGSATLASELHGGDGADTLIGGANADTLDGDDGADLLLGDGAGAVTVDTNNAVLVAGPGVRILNNGQSSEAASDESLAVFRGVIQTVDEDDQLIFDVDPNVVGPNGDQTDVIATGPTVFGQVAVLNRTATGFSGVFVDPNEANATPATGAITAFTTQEVLLSADGRALILLGTGGNDSLRGGDGADVILGNAGADSIDSGDGNDTVFGGADADSVYAGNGEDVLFGNDGDDTINSDGGTDSVSGGDGNDSILGGELNDTLLGDAGNDTVDGQSGDDSIQGGLGDDSLLGSNGRDSLQGNDGNDVINGGSGNDAIHGDAGSDMIFGGGGNDVIDGDEGDDTLKGQAGNDTVRGGGGTDNIDGGDGADFIRGNPVGISINDSQTIEGTSAVFTVTLSESSDLPVTIDYRTEDGSARLLDNDYGQAQRPIAGQLTFAPGETSLTIVVPTIDDPFAEPDEFFRVRLYEPLDGTPTNALIVDDLGIGTIAGGTDVVGRVSVSSAPAVLEGSLVLPGAATFLVNLSEPSTQSVTVLFTTNDGTAISGTDYQPSVMVPVTFMPGETQRAVNVQLIGNATPESNAAFTVSIQAAVGGNSAIVVGTATAEIVDDDLPRVEGAFAVRANSSNTIAVLDTTTGNTRFTIPTPIGVTLPANGFNGLAYDGTTLFLVPAGSTTFYTLNVTTANVANPIPPWNTVAQIGQVQGRIEGLAVLANAANQSRLYVLDVVPSGSRILEINPGAAPTNNTINPTAVFSIDFLSTVATASNPFGAGLRLADQSFLGLAGFENGNNDRLFVLNRNTLGSFDLDDAANNFPFVFEPNVDVVELQLDPPSGRAQIRDFFSVTVRETLSVNNNAPSFRDRNLGAPASIGAIRDPQNPANPNPVLFVGTNTNQVLQFNRGGQMSNSGPNADELRNVLSITSRVSDFGGDFNPANPNQSTIPQAAPGNPFAPSEPILLTTGTGDRSLQIGVNEVGRYGLVAPAGLTRTSPNAVFDPINSSPQNTTFESGVAFRTATSGPRDFLTIGNAGSAGDVSPIPQLVTRSDSRVETQFTQSGFNWNLEQSVDPLFDRNNQPIGSVLTQVYTVTNPGSAATSIEFARYLDADLFFGASFPDGGGYLTAADGREFLYQLDNTGTASNVNDYVAVTSFFEDPVTNGIVPGVAQHYAVDQFPGVRSQVTNGSQLPDAVFQDISPSDGFVDFFSAYDVTLALTNALQLGSGQTIRYVTQTFFATGAPEDLFINFATSTGPSDTLAGGTGDDTLVGGIGDSTIIGGAGDDSVLAGPGNDFVLGGAGRDTLDGQEGDDTLAGQGGADLLIGGDGQDTFQWNATRDGKDTMVGTSGADVLQVLATASADTIHIGASGEELLMTSGSNSALTAPTINRVDLFAGQGNDVITVGDLSGTRLFLLQISGEAGNDVINATGSGSGNVRMLMDGNDGNDTLIGGKGRDTLRGGNGVDNLKGGDGDDLVIGGAGADSLQGQVGDDTIFGDEMIDTVAGSGSGSADTLLGNEGNDLLFGGGGDDRLDGGDGGDTLQGNDGADTLNGMTGNDSLLGGIGTDNLLGGTGNDTLDGGRNDDSLQGNSGNDRLLGDHGNDFIDGGDGDNTVNGGDGSDTINTGAGNDVIFGGDGNDRINSDGGDDIISGGDGQDTIQAGSGNDLVLGRDGDDSINGQGGTDTLAGNEGNDNVIGTPDEIDEAFNGAMLNALLTSTFGNDFLTNLGVSV